MANDAMDAPIVPAVTSNPRHASLDVSPLVSSGPPASTLSAFWTAYTAREPDHNAISEATTIRHKAI